MTNAIGYRLVLKNCVVHVYILGAEHLGAFGDILACLSRERVKPACMLDGCNTSLQLNTVSSDSAVVNEIVTLLANNKERKSAAYQTGVKDEVLTLLQISNIKTREESLSLHELDSQQIENLHSVVSFLANPEENDNNIDSQLVVGDQVNCHWPHCNIKTEIIDSIVARETRMTSGTK